MCVCDVKKMTTFGDQEVLDLVAYAFQWELSEKNIDRYQRLAAHSWNYGSYDAQGKLASQVMATLFNVNLHGTAYPMAGIGFVASYPEYRGQGRIDQIMQEIIKDCYEQNIVLSYLAPFSFPFYRRYGYEYTFERSVYDIQSSDWPDSPKTAGSIKRLAWEQAQPIIHQIYHQQLKNQRGALIRDAWWEDIKFTLRKTFTFAVYYNASGTPEGYLIYSIEKGTFTIDEWGYLTGEAFHGLNRLIVSHRDSVAKIHYQVGVDSRHLQTFAKKPMPAILSRPDMMTRIIDLELFLQTYPFTKKEGKIALQIENDVYAPWNNGVYELSFAQQKPVVKRVEKTDLPCLTASIQRVGQLLFGVQEIDTCQFFGEVKADDAVVAFFQNNLPKGKPVLEDYF
ncbi:GNAT family N-acetyltransferase [Enterococcus sp.]|uniref:GNAT family N-acetyltransferase n=1 Tax=Enterococcus sp. TaxID=35783 RepID=UPI002897D076|nr:GNAT family N-acetyltransferase [Enterococcus sp.]